MTSAGGASSPGDALSERVLSLPAHLRRRIGVTAEALSILAPYCKYPVDCRLVAQQHRRASLLGHTQRAAAQAAPLCVLLDMAALQKRPGALDACLHWLLRHRGLQAVQIADGCQGSVLSEAQLALLGQLVAAHPGVASGVRHLGVIAGELGQTFDAALLAPFTHLRSLELRWFASADLEALPPSVRSVHLQLPGSSYVELRAMEARQTVQEAAAGDPGAAGAANAAAAAQVAGMIAAQIRALGALQPFSTVPTFRLQELVIDADQGWVEVDVAQAFGAAASFQLRRAATMQLVLPAPPPSNTWDRLDKEAWFTLPSTFARHRAVVCGFALLSAFVAAGPDFKLAQIEASQWVLLLPGLAPADLGMQVVVAAQGMPKVLERLAGIQSNPRLPLWRARTCCSMLNGRICVQIRQPKLRDVLAHCCDMAALAAIVGSFCSLPIMWVQGSNAIHKDLIVPLACMFTCICSDELSRFLAPRRRRH